MALTSEQAQDVRTAVALGHRPAAVAEAVSLSVRRVYQICQEERATADEVDAASAELARLAQSRDTHSALISGLFDGMPWMDGGSG